MHPDSPRKEKEAVEYYKNVEKRISKDLTQKHRPTLNSSMSLVHHNLDKFNIANGKRKG